MQPAVHLVQLPGGAKLYCQKHCLYCNIHRRSSAGQCAAVRGGLCHAGGKTIRLGELNQLQQPMYNAKVQQGRQALHQPAADQK